MKFTVITPCKNSVHLIEETINSVIYQTIFKEKKAQLEYLIVDNLSQDGTSELIKKYAKENQSIKFISEKDSGMYDAIAKALEQSSGDYLCYINAGDFYFKNAFNVVFEIFQNSSKIKWLTGNKIIYNSNSQLINFTIPYKYRNSLIKKGVYGKYLPFIQQESVFWKRELNNLINLEQLKKLRLAGDYYIWKCFAQKESLKIVQTYLGGFKIHENQLSSQKFNGLNYQGELNTFCRKVGVKDYFLIFIDIIPWAILKYSASIFGIISKHIIFDKKKKIWGGSRENNEIFVWCCDISRNRGEGKLALEFIKEKISLEFESVYIKNNFLFFDYKNIDKVSIKNQLNLNFAESYISPFFGILYLWYKFILGKKTCYLNFLPLWNSFLILLLPPGTIFGPITGSKHKGNIKNAKSLIRKYIIPTLYKINIYFLKFRSGQKYFSTSILKDYCSPKEINKYNFSFIMSNKPKKEINKKINEKKIDFTLYFREYDTKSNQLFKKIFEFFELNEKYVFKCLGSKISKTSQNDLGYISNYEVNAILNDTKYSIISEENIESFFSRECIANDVIIFCDMSQKNILDYKNIVYIDFYNHDEALRVIKKNLDLKFI